MNDIVEIELLPCPFCGSDQVDLEQTENGDLWYIQCYNCRMATDSYLEPVDIAHLWNRRAEPKK